MTDRVQLDLPLSNMNSLIGLALDTMLQNSDREGDHYRIPAETADQIMALLTAAKAYGTAQIALFDGRSA